MPECVAPRLTRLTRPSEINFRKRFFELVDGQTDAQVAKQIGVERSYITHLRRGRAFSATFKQRAAAVWPELVHYIAMDMMPKDGAA